MVVQIYYTQIHTVHVYIYIYIDMYIYTYVHMYICIYKKNTHYVNPPRNTLKKGIREFMGPMRR